MKFVSFLHCWSVPMAPLLRWFVLTVRADVACERDLLYRAFLCDPLVSSLADSQAMIDELLAKEAAVFPQEWSK